MRAIDIRVAPLGDRFPPPETRKRKRAAFLATYERSKGDLADELRRLGASEATLYIDVLPGHVTRDGRLHAQYRPLSPRIVLEAETRNGKLFFAFDRYEKWTDNLRALALTLEALRNVDRWGGTKSGEQYKGWAQLPAPKVTVSSVVEASRLLYLLAMCPNAVGITSGMTRIQQDGDYARELVLTAVKKAHPDREGGSLERWHELQSVRGVLSSHHGATV